MGRQADLVIPSDDLRSVDPNEIATVHVDMTVVGGQVRYERDPRPLRPTVPSSSARRP